MDTYRFLASVLLMGCFLLGAAHAAEHGDAPHEHDGVACEVVFAAEDEVGILPVRVAVPAPVFDSHPVYAAPYEARPYLRPQMRGSPRSPPALF